MRPKASWAGLICRTDQCFQRQRQNITLNLRRGDAHSTAAISRSLVHRHEMRCPNVISAPSLSSFLKTHLSVRNTVLKLKILFRILEISNAKMSNTNTTLILAGLNWTELWHWLVFCRPMASICWQISASLSRLSVHSNHVAETC